MAHNTAIDHVRARRPLLCQEVRGGDEACEESHQQSRDLREALDSLPEDQRLVIVMRFVLGLSPAEVAARMAARRTPCTVSSTGAAARSGLLWSASTRHL